MRIYFATNRNPDNVANPRDFGNSFSINGLTDLRFGWADVTGANLDKHVLTVASEQLVVDSKQAHIGDFSGQILGSQKVFDEVRKDMLHNRQDCVISIHGFNYTFREAVRRTAELKRFYSKRPMVFVLFTWPSDGSLLPFKAYASDRDDARASGVAIGRGMQKLAHYLRGTRPEDYCGHHIHIFAHSMGNYALRWAVQNIKSSAGSNIRRLCDQICLFAADEDDDAFELEHKLMQLPSLARRVTVYHNRHDSALTVSESTKGKPDRLGAGGPRNSRALPDKVTVVNCEPALSFKQDPTGHQYYRNNERVKADVLSVLDGIESQLIKQRKYQPETRSYSLERAK